MNIVYGGENTRKVPRSLITIQAKSRSLFVKVNVKFISPEPKLMASNGRPNRLKAHASLQNVKKCAEDARVNTKAAGSYPEILREIRE
jgi:hypothetical protein